MKLCLLTFCLLGFLSGAVLTKYTSISIGKDGLGAMASSLKSIESVMGTHHKNLNNARNRIMSSINSLVVLINSTYTSMNNSYGASEPFMGDVVNNLEWINRQFVYGEEHYDYIITSDVNQLSNLLQETMDLIMQNYNGLSVSYRYQQNSETCMTQFSGMGTSLPSQLAKFGTCLKTSADIVPTMVAPVQQIFNVVKKDFQALTKQLKICASSSTSCVKQYFNDINMEMMHIMSQISVAESLLSFHLAGSKERNMLCGELIKENVQDISSNLVNEFNRCMYPSNI
nr:uncharacterized protein LOC109399220 [Aedes albopictus]